MKKLIFIISLFIISGSAFAQSHPFYVGGFVAVESGINTVTIEGRVNAVGFTAPNIGASLFLPFTKESTKGVTLDIGYDQLVYTTDAHANANDNTRMTETYGYFSLAPYINLSGFILGFNIGIPLTASTQNAKGDEFDVDDPTEKMKTLFEVRIGGKIPLYKNDTGVLNLDIIAGYAVTGLLKEQDDNGLGLGVPEKYNPKPVSLSIGVSYLFNLGL